ncbi:Bug family tripartite tricarboxylate transporter substrate binding protein [Verticiella sediminum]|nr:tripartite tricarboxylate transporter substrate binding protein [Verticiella sediminum]
MIFERVQRHTGQAVVIENRGGASGMIGAAVVANAAPDGHTLVLAPSGPLAMNALLYKQMSYDPGTDLAPVSLVAETPTILVVANDIEASNANDLLAEMASPRRKLAYASPGTGTLGHLIMAYLVARSGPNADVPHVAYSGSPQIITALMAGDVQMAVSSPLTVAPAVASGKVRAIAAIGPERSAIFPDVPTLREQGIDFTPTSWFGLYTTGGTPAEIRDAIHREVRLALQDQGLLDSYALQGLSVRDLDPPAFAKYVQDDLALWKPIIEAYGIALD